MKKILFILGIASTMITNAQSWSLTGNSGTNPTNNFIGTTDNVGIIFKTNNTEKLRLTPAGRIVFQGLDNAYGWHNNVFIGAGNETVTGVGNYSFGVGSMNSLTTGNYNHAFGFNTLKNLTTGGSNIAIGGNSQMSNTTGNGNISIGRNTLIALTTGNYNTAFGDTALNGGSGYSITGNNNTGIGYAALRGVRNDASNNTVVGAYSFIYLRGGNNNIALGYNNAINEIQNANNNIYIGNNIVPFNVNPSSELNIGNWIMGNNGTIGIGTFTGTLPANGMAQDGEKYKLFVKDGIKTEKVKVDIASANGWADYVFKEDYKLPTLESVEKHIAEKGHLSNIPSSEEVLKNGINLGEMDAKLLEKIEELTLYIIQQNKINKDQQEVINSLKNRLDILEKK